VQPLRRVALLDRVRDEASARESHAMTPEQASQVWRTVYRRMGDWQAGEDNGHGGAFSTFMQFWREATAELGVPPFTLECHDAWLAWLKRGEPVSPERREKVKSMLEREPGQEG
jgi:hypothetical protein